VEAAQERLEAQWRQRWAAYEARQARLETGLDQATRALAALSAFAPSVSVSAPAAPAAASAPSVAAPAAPAAPADPTSPSVAQLVGSPRSAVQARVRAQAGQQGGVQLQEIAEDPSQASAASSLENRMQQSLRAWVQQVLVSLCFRSTYCSTVLISC
jgi:hypothetical protein